MSSCIELKPLTRVEGHGSVRVYRHGSIVEKVELDLCESPRLFEALLMGKPYRELPEIICRICSICSTVHRATSLAAIEHAFGVEVSRQTALYRDLIVLGGHMASHTLHLFCLALPDHYGVSSFAEVAAIAPEELKLGLRLKAAGNLIQETVGGRLIHPVTLIPGGMGKPPGQKGLQMLKNALEPLLDDARKGFDIFADARTSLPPLPLPCYLAVEGNDGRPFRGSHLTLSDGRGGAVAAYRDLIQEENVAYSHAKKSSASGTVVTVGALARLNIGLTLAPAAAKAFSSVRETIDNADIGANNIAQAVEVIHCLERSLEIIEELLSADYFAETPKLIEPRQASGTAAMEAPRGLLIHSYHFDSRGICTAADIMTPTAINQAAIERDLLITARALERSEEAYMLHQLEVLVRAYDPCISCSVHVVEV